MSLGIDRGSSVILQGSHIHTMHTAQAEQGLGILQLINTLPGWSVSLHVSLQQ